MLFRVLGGDQPRQNTEFETRREADRLVLAHILWHSLGDLRHLPERTAQEVGKLFGDGK